MASLNRRKINHAKINTVLGMTVDMTEAELGILINKLREEQSRRNLNDRDGINKDTISL